MKKVYIGIDAHKESNLLGSAFDGREEPEVICKEPEVICRERVRERVSPGI